MKRGTKFSAEMSTAHHPDIRVFLWFAVHRTRLCLFGNPQLEQSVLLTVNFCADSLPKVKDFRASIRGYGETVPE